MRKSIDEYLEIITPNKRLKNPAWYLELKAIDVFAFITAMDRKKYNASELCDSLKRWLEKDEIELGYEEVQVYDVLRNLVPKHRKFSQYTSDEKKLLDALVMAPF